MPNEKTKTASEYVAIAVKAALHGGRKYGTAQHKVAVKTLANMLVSSESEEDTDNIVAAIVGISNMSATQLKLDKARLIDREQKGKAKASVFADLATI